MADLMITPDDITEILKKIYKLKNPYESIENLTKTDVDNFIIESEISKFCDTFNRIFDEELLPVEINKDSEDGALNDIGLKIVETIKESLEKVDKEKLLKLLFKLISKLVFNDSGEN